mgnify:FL=1
MINYVVPFWFGPRGCKKYNEFIQSDKFYFVKQHVDFLNSYSKKDIHKSTFVLNSRSEEESSEAREFFSEINLDSGIKVVLLIRDNRDENGLVRGSYGGWNDAMVSDILEETGTETFLLFEEDYILVDENCVQPYVERCTEENPIVCSYVMNNSWIARHISHSCPTAFNAKVCKKIYDKNNDVLYFLPRNENLNDYLNLCEVQLWCHKYFRDDGYDVSDVLDEYSTGYLYCNQPGFPDELLVVFGNPQNETLVIPIGYKDYEYEDPYKLMPSTHIR